MPATAQVIGNSRSHVYHVPHCRGVASMNPANRVEFKTAAEAEAQGYRRGKECD